MPFKSKAQQRWMFAAEARGEVPEGTAHRWAKHTKNMRKLPEKVSEKEAQSAAEPLLSPDAFTKLREGFSDLWSTAGQAASQLEKSGETQKSALMVPGDPAPAPGSYSPVPQPSVPQPPGLLPALWGRWSALSPMARAGIIGGGLGLGVEGLRSLAARSNRYLRGNDDEEEPQDPPWLRALLATSLGAGTGMALSHAGVPEYLQKLRDSTVSPPPSSPLLLSRPVANP
jgi:hypothetical protein